MGRLDRVYVRLDNEPVFTRQIKGPLVQDYSPLSGIDTLVTMDKC